MGKALCFGSVMRTAMSASRASRSSIRSVSTSSIASAGRVRRLERIDVTRDPWTGSARACAPTRTPRELLAIDAVPFARLRPIGLAYRLAREVVDVGFSWTRPYVADGDKLTRRFGFQPTPFEIGIPATIRAPSEGH